MTIQERLNELPPVPVAEGGIYLRRDGKVCLAQTRSRVVGAETGLALFHDNGFQVVTEFGSAIGLLGNRIRDLDAIAEICPPPAKASATAPEKIQPLEVRSDRIVFVNDETDPIEEDHLSAERKEALEKRRDELLKIVCAFGPTFDQRLSNDAKVAEAEKILDAVDARIKAKGQTND